MYRLARIKQKQVKNLAIRCFIKATGATLDEANRKQIKDYDSLLDFFTRELDPTARPISQPTDGQIITSPVDGRVAHVGQLLAEQIFQLKGYTYSLTDLVGADYAQPYLDGQATTIYLAPFDYHRIHMPMNGILQRAKYIPGELNSVSIKLLDKIAGLFAKNERVVMEFSGDNQQPFLMVLVGAVNVGSIETVMHGEICPNQYNAPFALECHQETLQKGDELGRFNLGSTIVFITPNDHHDWQLVNGQKTQMGQTIGQRKRTAV